MWTQLGIARVAVISIPLLLTVKLAENASEGDGQLLAPNCAQLLNNPRALLHVHPSQDGLAQESLGELKPPGRRTAVTETFCTSHCPITGDSAAQPRTVYSVVTEQEDVT